jgi:hypothetical protein
MKRLASITLALTLTILGFGHAAAQEVIAGLDFFESPGGISNVNVSSLVSGNCPGCAVVGSPIVQLKGAPLETHPSCPGNKLGNTDTIVRRINTTIGLNGPPPQNATIPIEIVALNLVSINPITVQCPSGVQRWTVTVNLQPVPQPPGQMSIHKTHPNGGTFDSFLPVRARFIFTRIDQCPAQPPFVVCTANAPTDNFQSSGVPWSYSPGNYSIIEIPGCTTNFYPGVNPFSPVLDGGGTPPPFSEAALLAAHGVTPPQPPKLNQRRWQKAVHFEFTLKNTGKQPIDDFHIFNPRYIPMNPPGVPPDSSVFIKSCSICDTIPEIWPPPPPVQWCQVEWDSLSPRYRKYVCWWFPPLFPDQVAPDFDIVFSVPNSCPPPNDSGAWYEVDYACTQNCVIVDQGTFRFRCDPENPLVGIGGDDEIEFEVGSMKSVLDQNIPNPFNPFTTIRYRVQQRAETRLVIFNLQGQVVRTLDTAVREPGVYDVIWDGNDDSGRQVASGTYLYQVEIGGVREAKKMVMLK